MNLLSIQGHFAPAFRLNETAKEVIKRYVETITRADIVIISSKFRTDLIFYDQVDHMEEIIIKWCDITGHTFKESTKLKFFRSCNELHSITHFFYRLYLLSRMPLWYKMYHEQLLSTWIENPRDPLLGTIMKVMTQLDSLFNDHAMKLNENEFRQIAQRFIDFDKLALMDKNRAN